MSATTVIEPLIRERVKTLFSYLEEQEHGDYLGEALSQLEHSLQAAALAANENQDDSTILASLLHDIGRFVPKHKNVPENLIVNGLNKAPHAPYGEAYLRSFGFNDKICQLVGAHVDAKRFLTATDKGYYDTLSIASKKSLRVQGGPFTEEQVDEYKKDPYLKEKLLVRIWDDKAKDPNLKAAPISTYEDMAVKSLLENVNVSVHGRQYNTFLQKPAVVVCVDGFDPEYLEQGIKDGILPNLARFTEEGFYKIGKSAMPSFTNPNNMSIISGAPPSKHGISGNFVFDKKTGQSEMILDDKFVRGTTILAEISERKKVVVVTAKDKLRKLLQHGLAKNSICFSTEKMDQCTKEEHGITNVPEWLGRSVPDMYSGDLSLAVLEAGVRFLEEDIADIYYLTLSDFIQHKHAPGSEEANEFLCQLDKNLGLLAEKAVVGITGDHGMSDKSDDEGVANILYLQDDLEKKFGKGSCKVICPITDPFVKHHGALGSFVRVYTYGLNNDQVVKHIRDLEPVEFVEKGIDAAEKLDLPADNEADIVVVSKKRFVLGSTASEHDLSDLTGRLRTHGGFSEQEIPLIVSEKRPNAATRENLRNFDIFDLVLNK